MRPSTSPGTRFPRWTRGAVAGIGAGALVVAGCNEHFVTGPRDSATLELRNWSDTLVVGEQRASHVLVLDADGHEIVGAHVTWQTATPAVLGTRLYGQAAPTGATIDANASSDSLALTGARPGTSDVLVALADTRFAPTQLARRATVVVAGVGVTSAHDTTATALGDTIRVTGTAFSRSGSGLAASLRPLAAQGITWTRRGPGAVTLVGTGDSVRAIATAPGVDTLIATHAFCLRGARCADTTVVHVAQTAQPLALGATTYRAWSFGDSVSTQVVVQDARGNAIPGVQLALVPLAASDSAVVGVNTSAGVPAASRTAGPAFSRTESATPATATPAARPLRLVIARSFSAALAKASVSAPAATPITAPPLVAQANGTARVAVQARLADGTVLGADTVSVIVRQVAKAVRVTPAYSDLTPGDSIPVHVDAHDARGHLIEDATFAPAMAGAIYRDGRIVVPTTAGAGTGVLQALVTGVASPGNNPGAPIPTPPPDTARIAVRVPPAMLAGDTTASDANTLGVTIRDRDGTPLRNAWVRFRIPAGSLQGPDSVLSDANGVVVLHWTLPTQPGSYTATAVLLGLPTPTDTAGLIVLRRTAVVTAGTPATLGMVAQPPATSAMGVALAPAPVVQLVDRYGNPVTQAGVTITAGPAAGATGFQWSGTLSATTGADGQAHFPAITGSGTPGSYALQFTAAVNGTATTPVVSTAIRFSLGGAQVGQSTAVISAPSIASGTTATVVVTPRDAYGNVLGAGQSVTVTLPATTPAGQATATISPVVDNGDGTYTATLTGVRAGSAFPIGATVGGAALAGPTLAVTAGAPATLTIATQPTAASAMSVALSPAPVVQLTDRAGNAVPLAGVVVTAAPAPATSGFTWGGTLTATTGANGQAQFPAVTGNGTPGSYALEFTAAANGAAVSPAVSRAVQFSIGAVHPGQSTVTISVPTVTSGATATVVVTPRDANHNLIGAGLTVTVTVPGTPASGVATATPSAVVDNGNGTYTATLTGVRAGTAFSIGATAGGVALTGPTLAVTAGAPSALTIATQPPAASGMNVALSPAPVVQLVDRAGNSVALAGVVVTANASGGTGFTWAGTLSASTSANGQAQFAAVTGNGAPGNYALQFSATANGTALTAVTSSVVHFVVGPVHPGHSSVVVSAPSIVSGTTATVVVTPRDANNNLIGPGQTVTVTVPGAPASGAATATPSAVVDNGDGTYTATLTGVRAGSAFAIGATVGGVALTSPTLAVTAGAAAALAISPASATMTVFGAGTPFTATAVDAAGNPVPTTGLTWGSSTTGVATIATSGTPTAASNGATTITATLGGVSRTATLTVQQVAATLTKQAGDGQTATMSTSVATALVVRALDANGYPVVGATVNFAVASGAGSVAGGSTQAVTTVTGGLATAGSWVLGGTTGANSVTATITGVTPVTFTATAGPALALTNTATERLRGGTQQFGIAAGPSGPYTWSVGGVDGGNSTYGTVSTSGFYTAPANVPSPNIVQLCARVGPAATQQACAAVTVVATPSAGGDVVVMNDNVPLSGGSAAYGGAGLDGTHPATAQFLANLVGYTASGARASQTHVLVYQGHGALNLTANPPFDSYATAGTGLDSLRTQLTRRGFTMDTSRSTTLTIPTNVKVVLLYMPTVAFSTAEVNAIKQFAADGGRLVFIGNQTAYYGTAGVSTENNLMTRLGSALVNTSAQLLNGGANATPVGSHQLTTGVSGVWFNTCSYMTVGPNDFALMTAGVGGQVVLAVTKIDVTPLP